MAKQPTAGEMKATLLAMSNGNGAQKEIELPAYPIQIWPDVLAEYFTAYAKMVDAPIGMIACPAAPVIAAAVGNTRPVGEKEGHLIHPAIWTAEIAEPSTAKSPMLAGARELVVPPQRAARKRYLEAQETYARALAEARGGGPDPGDPPTEEHFYSDDYSIEAVHMMTASSAGIVVANDELLRWLKSFNAYKGKGGADWQTWLSFWNGISDFRTNRKGTGTTISGRAVVNVCGSIQPDRLPELSQDAVKDGMLARFLMSTYPSRVPRVNEFTLPVDLFADAVGLVEQLRRTPPVDAVYLSRSAWTLYQEWWNDDQAPATEKNRGPVKHFLGKLKEHVLKLAALLHCVHDPKAVAQAVSRRTFEDAIELLDYHRAHTLAAYQYLAIPSDQNPVNPGRKILWTLRRLGGSATREEIREARSHRDSAAELDAIFDALEREGKITVEIVKTGGRDATRYTLKTDAD